MNFNYAIGILDKFSGPLAKLDKGLQKMHGQFQRVQKAAGQMGSKGSLSFDKLGDAAFRFNNILSTVGQGFGELDKVIQKSAALSDKMAIVQKNTGMSTKEVEKLKSSLDGIDTRTSLTELFDMASSAGKLGVGKADIPDFVKAADMANVALGDEFSGGAGEIATVFAKIQSQFKDLQKFKPAESLMRIGSAVNYLGKQGANSAPNVTNFMQRASTTGLDATQAAALGATLEEVGLSAEIASGGVKGIFGQMSVETKAFAKQVGMTEKQWKALVNIDPNAAFMRFIESTKGYSNTQFAATMKSVKIGTQEASDVVKKLSGDMDRLKERQIDALTAAQLADDMKKEFALLNNTAGAELDKMKKKMDSVAVAVGGFIGPWGPLISTGGMAIMSFSAMLPLFGAVGSGFMALVGKVKTLTKAQKGAAGSSLLLNARMKAVQFGAFAKGLLSTAGAALRTAGSFMFAALSGLGAYILSLASATLAQLGFNVALSANPIGAVIVGIAALGGAIWLLVDNWEWVKAKTLEFWKTLVNTGQQAIAWFTNTFPRITETLLKVWEYAKWLNPVYAITQGLKAAFPEFEMWLDSVWSKITGLFDKVYNKGQEVFGWFSEKLGFGETEFTKGKREEMEKAEAALKKKQALEYQDKFRKKWVGNYQNEHNVSAAEAIAKYQKKYPNGAPMLGAQNKDGAKPTSPTNLTPTTNANVKNGLDSVAGGGSKPTNIYIEFEAINQGGISVTSNNLGAGLDEVERQVQDMLLRVVNSANQIGGE